jgi:hypothetical protein
MSSIISEEDGFAPIRPRSWPAGMVPWDRVQIIFNETSLRTFRVHALLLLNGFTGPSHSFRYLTEPKNEKPGLLRFPVAPFKLTDRSAPGFGFA